MEAHGQEALADVVCIIVELADLVETPRGPVLAVDESDGAEDLLGSCWGD